MRRAIPLLLATVLSASLSTAQVNEAAPPAAPLGPQQQLEKAKEMLSSMDEAAGTVQTALAQAKANRDVVKVLCLNDKLNQINIARRSAKGRTDALGQAAAENDVAKARHDFSVLEILDERVSALVGESNQCVGEEVGFIGEAATSVAVDPQVPDPDPDEFGSDLGVVLDSPVLSSPVL